MDFAIPPELRELQERTRGFVRERIIPYESDARQTRHGPTDGLRRELNALAAEAGLLSPHVAPEWGGLGLSHVGRA
ncbi:MAG: acyl-CoA dehydrogenase family protein, partial [Acetobacteraceae bacterium]|nr:acyl-CoA dehydrogenase family protein [Acetobacteraceae bacterium]